MRVVNNPSKTPLIIMVIINSLLLIPGILSILFLFSAEVPVLAMFPVLGLIFYLGYFYSLITNKYNSLFWVCSFLYNFLLFSGCTGFIIYQAQGYESFGFLIMIPLWSLFMTVGSWHYFKESLTSSNI